MALGIRDSLGGPPVASQIVVASETDDFYLGLFGLGHQGTNISNFTDPHPTFLTALKNEGLIPSLSWAYTAGARYRKYSYLVSQTASLRSLLFPSWVTKSKTFLQIHYIRCLVYWVGPRFMKCIYRIFMSLATHPRH